MTVVIYGPMATGKTFHGERFRSHYRCVRVLDEWDLRHTPMQHRDLILTTRDRASALVRFPGARVVSINTARAAIGLEAAPKGGFFARG